MISSRQFAAERAKGFVRLARLPRCNWKVAFEASRGHKQSATIEGKKKQLCPGIRQAYAAASTPTSLSYEHDSKGDETRVY